MNTWASTGGSGVQIMDPVTGQYVDAGSPEGKQYLDKQRGIMAGQLQKTVSAQQNLANAEVEADAQNYEAEQNRAAGQAAFQTAIAQAGSRRAPGGGIARGGVGRRGISLNQATGGLAAANAAARRKAQQGLATARVAANPEVMAAQSQLDVMKANTPALPAYAKPRRIGG
jgi:hypothetical protein